MLGYAVVNEQETWKIVERDNEGIVVAEFNDKDSAYSLMKHFNLGGGFDGFTPTFMTRKIDLSKLPQ